MKKGFLLGVVLITLFLTACSIIPEPTRGKQVENEKAVTLTVQNIREGLPNLGTSFIDAYISEVYTCPPCPETGFCPPCVGNHLIIADVNEYIPNYVADTRAFFLFVDDVSMFAAEKKYHFIVELLAYEEQVTSRDVLFISAQELLE